MINLYRTSSQLVIVIHFSLSESIKVTRDSIAASSLLETGQIPDGWLPTDSGLYIPSHFSYGFSCVLGLRIELFVWFREAVVMFIFFVLWRVSCLANEFGKTIHALRSIK